METIEELLRGALPAIKGDRENAWRADQRDMPPSLYGVFRGIEGEMINLNLPGFMEFVSMVGKGESLSDYAWTIHTLMTNVYLQDDWSPVWPDNPTIMLTLMSDGYVYAGEVDDQPEGRLGDDYENNPNSKVTEAMTFCICRRTPTDEAEFGFIQAPYVIGEAGHIVWGTETIIRDIDATNTVIDGRVAMTLIHWVTLTDWNPDEVEGETVEIVTTATGEPVGLDQALAHLLHSFTKDVTDDE